MEQFCKQMQLYKFWILITVKPVYKDRSRDQKKAVFIDRWSLYEGSRFYMSTSNLTV